MSFARSRRGPASLALLGAGLVLGGCAEDSAAPPSPVDATGSLQVTVSTAGPGNDVDGYVVAVGTRTQTTGANGTVTFEGLEAGSHAVELTGVAAQCRSVGDATASAVVSAGATTEVAFQVECDLWQQVACPELALQAGAGAPLAEISLGPLPATFELPLAAAVAVDGEPLAALAPIEPLESAGNGEEPGPLALVVPLHPLTPLEGGAVELTVSDGSLACAPVPFEIQPLPEAPGELAAVVDELQQALSAQAVALGTTTETLVSTPLADLQPSLWPLALAQTVLDDPANEESLRAIANGALGEEAVALLDGILSRTGLRAELTDGAPAVVAEPASGAEPTVGAEGAASAIGCDVEFVNGSSPQALHDCMEAAAAAKREMESISRRVRKDIGRALFAVLERGGPVGEAAAAAIGYLGWVLESETAKAASLYPSRFTNIEVELSHVRFMEDDTATGKVEWVNVYATSEGYDLQKEIIDGFKEAANLAETTGKFEISAGEELDKAVERLKSALEQRAREMEIEELDISAELFGPIAVGVPQWTDMDVVAGEAIQFVPDLQYRPWVSGPSTLEVRTEDGMFGGEQIAARLEVTVGTINIVFTPLDTLVAASAPGSTEFVDFDVKIEDALFPDSVDIALEYTVQGAAEIDDGSGTERHVYYLPPEKPVPGVEEWVAVRYTGQTGARANGPERLGKARIRFGTLTISPRGGCLEPGETLEFSAEVEGLTSEAVDWSADAGSISGDGLFTAPGSPPPDGIVTITAESVENSLVRDQVDVRVGGCSCGFSVTVDGETFSGTSGDELALQVSGDPVSTFGVDITDAGLGLLIRWDPMPLGDTGSVHATVLSGTFYPLREWFAFGSAPEQRLAMDVTTNDGDLFRAEITGPVTLRNQEGEERAAAVSGWFSVGWDSGAWQTGGNRCSVESP